MGHERLHVLALLSIEAKLVQEIDYEEIIDVFARAKARKNTMLDHTPYGKVKRLCDM